VISPSGVIAVTTPLSARLQRRAARLTFSHFTSSTNSNLPRATSFDMVETINLLEDEFDIEIFRSECRDLWSRGRRDRAREKWVL